MNLVFIVFIGLSLILGTTDVDEQPGDVVGPVVGGNLCVSLDSISVRLVYRVCVVFACLYSLAFELLGDLRDKLVIVG